MRLVVGKVHVSFDAVEALVADTAFQPSEPSYTFVYQTVRRADVRVSSAEALYIASVNQVDGALM